MNTDKLLGEEALTLNFQQKHEDKKFINVIKYIGFISSFRIVLSLMCVIATNKRRLRDKVKEMEEPKTLKL